MKISLGFQPFNDYWITCYYNKILTLLISIDPGYKLAAYMNDDNDIIKALVRKSKQLQDGWLIIRSKHLIIYRSKADRTRLLASLNEDVRRLFQEEMELWESVIENLKPA